MTIHQAEKGYRFSVDAVLLAGLLKVGAHDRIVDLGTGCGIVPLILAHRGQGGSAVGIEIQPELARLARKNVEVNGFADRINIEELDFREIESHFGPASFDLAVSNPPYRRLHSGRVNPIQQRAIARHELAGSVQDVFVAARYLLAEGGRLAVIYPASRAGRLFSAAQQSGFNPKRLFVIYSSPSEAACLVFLECRKGGGEGLRIDAPFFIYGKDGDYTEAMRSLYEK